MNQNIQSFSLSSDQYAKHRPLYPAELFSFLSEFCSEHQRVWDCATGNGQAAISCAKYFDHIEATDGSVEQIRHRLIHPKVNYGVCLAEDSPFANDSFDLVMVAQAFHWFKQGAFFSGVERTLKSNGILAIWGYGFLEIEPDIDHIISKHLLELIDSFWAEGNRLVMNGYRDVKLPFDAIQNPPQFTMTVEWNLHQLSDYFRTWSAVKRFIAESGTDPIHSLETMLSPFWQNPDESKPVHMPLFFKASRKSG